MNLGVWSKAVLLERYGQPEPIVIVNSAEAARLLLASQPSRQTRIHTEALMACRDALNGQGSAALARCEFIEAAMEAGYYILPETFLSPGSNADDPVMNLPQPDIASDRNHHSIMTSSQQPSLAELFDTLGGLTTLFGSKLTQPLAQSFAFLRALKRGRVQDHSAIRAV